MGQTTRVSVADVFPAKKMHVNIMHVSEMSVSVGLVIGCVNRLALRLRKCWVL